ncbi:MAG: hypothetical protein E7589_06955 [Ruminococcaceae bacterium]|nr:hypothetical protein [Oscillospiraceae bacterium]
MNSEDIFEAIGEIDDDLLAREERSDTTKRRNIFMKIGAVAASFAVVAAAVTYTVKHFTAYPPNNDSFPPTTDAVNGIPLKDNSLVLWNDGREYNNTDVIMQNSAYIWPWDCRKIHDQFGTIEFDGNRYGVRMAWVEGENLPTSMLAEKLGDGVGKGYDVYEEKEYTIDCEIFSIKGVADGHIAAVKYYGHDEIYVIIKEGMPEYDTLGDMISFLNLTENIVFAQFYHNEGKAQSALYGVDSDTSAEIWKLLAYCSDAKSVEEPYFSVWVDGVVSFTLNSKALGVDNMSFGITDSGYVVTNLMNYAHYFYIGEDAAAQIIEYTLAHKTEAPPATTFKLIGRITEVGEDYIKIDDSVMMKNEDDGMIFTVYATDMNVKRYLMRGFLHVGELVVITHEGIYADAPTVVTTAINLEEADYITKDGDVYIPE